MNCSGNGDVVLLCYTVLVPAYIGEDECVFRESAFKLLEDSLRCHGESAVIGDCNVGGFELLFCLRDLLTETGTLDSFGLDSFCGFENLSECEFQVCYCADFNGVIPADFCRVNVNLEEFRCRRVKCYALIPA